MQFTAIKKRMMPFFADCLQGRLDLHAAVYRKAHDTEKVIWLTLDGAEYVRFASIPVQQQQQRLYDAAKSALPARPEHFNLAIFQSDWYKASQCLWQRVEEQLQEEGQFDSYEVWEGLVAYPNLTIEAARQHASLFVRGFAVLDRRFGQRQLAKLDATQLSKFEQLCYDLRLEAAKSSDLI